jgi:glutamate--cysteine ligase
MEHPSRAPLSVDAAIEYVAATCLSPGPPRTVGVELEWLVNDARDPTLPVDPARVAAALPEAGALSGRLTREPGGQVELSSAPAPSLAAAVAAGHADLRRLRADLAAAGLRLTGRGADPARAPVRVVHTPRYEAMETFFDRSGPDGRIMMCSTASVQVCLDAGLLGGGTAGIGHRWRVAHAIGPVLVAAFANSPRHAGRPTGWKSTRQAVWARLDPSRTAAPRGADPALAWAQYALDARVLCVRHTPNIDVSGSAAAHATAAHATAADAGGGEVPSWPVPVRLTFRDWLTGAGPRPATIDDLEFHLTTLFPPVRPRRWLELRMIDAQSGDDGWVVPVAVATALMEDGVAGGQALAATEQWDPFDAEPSLRAARFGLADPDLRDAATRCFEAARGALGRLGAPRAITETVDRFAERYVSAGRCPADDAESTAADATARLEKTHDRSHH